MAASRKHPVDELIRIATDASELMWRCYHNHLGTVRYDDAWQVRATEILARCTGCDERLLKLKDLRTRTLGPKPVRAEPPPPDELRLQSEEAEWDVRRLRHLLACHDASQPQDENWKAQQLRLMTGLRNAMSRLVDVSEKRETT